MEYGSVLAQSGVVCGGQLPGCASSDDEYSHHVSREDMFTSERGHAKLISFLMNKADIIFGSLLWSEVSKEGRKRWM